GRGAEKSTPGGHIIVGRKEMFTEKKKLQEKQLEKEKDTNQTLFGRRYPVRDGRDPCRFPVGKGKRRMEMGGLDSGNGANHGRFFSRQKSPLARAGFILVRG